MAKSIKKNNLNAYRNELNNLVVQSLLQLGKIKELIVISTDYDFINQPLRDELETLLVHGIPNKQGEQLFKNRQHYSDEKLHQILD